MNQELWNLYASTPRDRKLAANLAAQYGRASRGVVLTLVGSLASGVPLSFLRFRSSRPWEPIDMLVVGAIVAVFAVPIAGVFVAVLGAYLRLFRTGRLVEARVTGNRGGGSVLQVATGVGPDRTYIPGLAMAPGQSVPAIVGDAASSRVLVVVAQGELRRGSLLTQQQLGEVAGV